MSDSDDGGGGVPEWVVTYGDMMSLLLTFFIMLVSLSELKKEGQIRAMMDAIRERFGNSMSGTMGTVGPSFQTTGIKHELASRGSRSEGGTKRTARKSRGAAGPHHTVQRINHGTVVTLGGPALFPASETRLNRAARENLDVIAEVVGSRPNRIVVRGHAAAEFVRPAAWWKFEPRLRDRMDLSFARAKAVADYLVQKGIDQRRLIVSASGDTEPRILTQDEEAQKANRRVDVFIIDSYITSPLSTNPTTP